MPHDYIYLGKSTLQRGRLLSIPAHIRENFNINHGDSMEIHAEGNMIILKPTKEAPWKGAAEGHKELVFEGEQDGVIRSGGEIRYPLKLVQGFNK